MRLITSSVPVPTAQVELDPFDTSPAYGTYFFPPFITGYPEAGDRIVFGTGGFARMRQPALTGMIQWKHRASVELEIISEEFVFDNTLHDLGTIAQADLNIAATASAGVGADDWVPFRVTLGTIGRRHKQKLTGPDGDGGSNDKDQFVGYTLSVVGGTTEAPAQSASTKVYLPKFKLPPPEVNVSGPGTWTPRLFGSVEVRDFDPAGSNQGDTVKVWDDDIVGDDLLDDILFTTVHNPLWWDGLLVGYSIDTSLWIDTDGNIAGPAGSSNQNSAEVYQQLIRPGLPSNIESDSVDFPEIP